ncbi:MAG: hypothetical protein PGN20_01645 [Agrobacterium cavarae]
MSNIPPPQPPKDTLDTNVAGEINAFDARLSALEAKIDEANLSGEARHRELLIQETQQRIRVRYWVVGISVAVLVFMAAILSHAAHHYFWGPIILMPPSVAIVMFVAPIVSVSTITIFLLFGAFRRFKDDDVGDINVPSIAAEGLKASLGK